MPAWPVSQTTMVSRGSQSPTSFRIRSGRIGSASESLSGFTSARHSFTAALVSSIHLALRAPLPWPPATASFRALSATFASPSSETAIRIIPPQIGGINSNLNDRSSGRRNFPEMRDLPGGLAPDVENEIGAHQNFICAGTRVRSGDADIKRIVFRDEGHGVQRSRHGNRKSFRKFQNFRPGARQSRAAAHDNHGPFRLFQNSRGLGNARRLRRGPVSGNVRERFFRNHLQVGHIVFNVAFFSREQEIHRRGRAGRGLAKRLPQQIGQSAHAVHLKIRFRDLRKDREIIHFLIIDFVFLVTPSAARKGDHRAVAHVRVAQTRRQIGRAHGLSSADAGPPGSARVTVRHVGGRLLAVSQNALDGHVVHFGEGAAEHRRDEKESGHALGIQKFRDKSASGDLCQSLLL